MPKHIKIVRELFELPAVNYNSIIKKREASVPDISMLNSEQLNMFNGVMELLSSDGGCIGVIEGTAGSGKTFSVSRIIEMYLSQHFDRRICFSSTTNRSVKVSFKSTEFRHPSLDFATIHKLLALKETVLIDGSIDFFPDKFIIPVISTYKVVFIDECSQFSKKLWAYLAPHIDNGLKVIMIGDPYQTPPVKETDSIVFTDKFKRENNAATFRLTKIVRQAADNPIIEVASFVRDSIDRHINLGQHYSYSNKIWQKDLGVQLLDRGDRKDNSYFDALLSHAYTSDNFKADGNFVKCVAWRNKTVNALNKAIRRLIYGKGKLRRIEPMERLITKQPVFDGQYDTVLINNGEQLEVIDFERQQESINNGQYVLHYYDTKVRYYDLYNNAVIKRINIPTDLGAIAFNEVSTIMAEHAKSFKPGTAMASTAWREFYKFQKSFANVGHDYAGTVHTCQGQTIQNTIVLDFDIQGNRKLIERNKILYTGITRASDRLFII